MIAGNTTQTMKPKEVNVVVPVQSSDVNKPEIDQAAPILPEPVNEAFELPEDWPRENGLYGESPLRARVISLEERLDALEDRIAHHNVNSAWKI